MEMTDVKKTITVNALARVEGEGALTIRFSGGRPQSAELRIFEPPRFFEALLVGRGYQEAPDITARICGICPVAYQMSACHAMEDALGLDISPEIRALRRLLYAGEWIESHVLHMFMLHAPDFLGRADVVELSEAFPEQVAAALRMKKAGNAIVNLLGGREIHPINVRVGGFWRIPTREELRALAPELEATREQMLSALDWIADFDFPDFEHDVELVALRHDRDYPMSEGRVVSSRGLDITPRDFEAHFEERQVPHSTALHCMLRERAGYLCGPLARLNLNADHLRPAARGAVDRVGLALPCKNPFKSILARGIEVIQAADEALEIIDTFQGVQDAPPSIRPRAGEGFACTEAPRGILYHHYRLAEDGSIASAKIVPPTSQNQATIEADLLSIAERLVDLPKREATELAERTVRNYDPCISCSTHFLDLRFTEEEP
ncbi:MAG: Ni/Fe hydrogenase subunit alpha [Myxococcales bacterium]|nr:Ni/Fe hydrogenase subunit alpha [Myxococcales bacterium]